MVATAVYQQKDVAGVVQLLPADALNKKDILTGEAAAAGVSPGGTYVTELSVASTETANNKSLAFYLQPGGAGTDYLLGVVTIPANAGFNGSTVKFDVLKSAIFANLPYNALGNKELFIPPLAKLKCAVLGSAIAATKELDISWRAGQTSAL